MFPVLVLSTMDFQSTVHFFYFFFKLASGRNPPNPEMIGSESGRYFSILPANPGGIVGSLIHKFVCYLWMSKNRDF